MNLINKIRSKFSNKNKEKYDDGQMVDIHHLFMKEYGWIPYEKLFGINEYSVIEYSIPIIIPKPWYKPWLWKLSKITLIAKKEKINKGLPLPTIWNLMDCISKEKERESKEMKKMKR